MDLIENIAFVFHENWRQTRLKKNGSFKPRWKKINNANFIAKLKKSPLPNYIRNTEDNYEIDIANACYTQLSSEWQNENKAAAKIVTEIINSNKKLTKNEIGSIIHNAWLERNPSAKNGELGVAFENLTKVEQDKDLLQFKIALTMSKAKVECGKHNIRTLKDVVEFLVQENKNGRNIAYKFNGHTLYSKFDTPDTCFLKVCGMTIEESKIADKESQKKYKEKIAIMSAKRNKKVLEWQKKGETLIYPQRKSSWYRCVERRANDLFYGHELINAIEVMESLEKGEDIKTAIRIAEKAEHSGASWFITLGIVTNFSKRGPEFYRANNKNIEPEIERLLQKIENDNKHYESIARNKDFKFGK